jgi:hypothetical protein
MTDDTSATLRRLDDQINWYNSKSETAQRSLCDLARRPLAQRCHFRGCDYHESLKEHSGGDHV